MCKNNPFENDKNQCLVTDTLNSEDLKKKKTHQNYNNFSAGIKWKCKVGFEIKSSKMSLIACPKHEEKKLRRRQLEKVR